jgi:hypothetical protein
MVRNRKQRSYTAEAAAKRMDWLQSVDADATQVAEWDIKTELLRDAVLGTLGMGSAIMFGVSLTGSAVSVTVYVGEAKHRKWVSDSVELEDFLSHICGQVKQATYPNKQNGLRAVGD